MTDRIAWRLWRIVQERDGLQIVVWTSPDGDPEHARVMLDHYATVAPSSVKTELQFQDPPPPPPWETASMVGEGRGG